MDILVRQQIISSMCLLLFSLFTAESQTQSPGLFNNGIRGFPNVACGAEKVIVRLDTIRPFKGRVFVKGESHKSECIRSYTQNRPVPVEDGLREHFGLFKRRAESLPKLKLLQQSTADAIPADLSDLKNLVGFDDFHAS
ncbi:hypothetical protein D918_05320 [Trichuris suis]|nr:hypothetical protein D918_05320 [Trichuris suis]